MRIRVRVRIRARVRGRVRIRVRVANKTMDGPLKSTRVRSAFVRVGVGVRVSARFRFRATDRMRAMVRAMIGFFVRIGVEKTKKPAPMVSRPSDLSVGST